MNSFRSIVSCAVVAIASVHAVSDDGKTQTTPKSGDNQPILLRDQTSGGFTRTLSPAALDRLANVEADAKSLPLHTVNRFHQQFFERCIKPLNGKRKHEQLSLVYKGPLSTIGAPQTLWIEDNDGPENYLDWTVEGATVVFGFWISTKKRPDTVGECKIDKKSLFINVSYVDGQRGINEQLAALGDQSVQSVIDEMKRKNTDRPQN